MSKKKVRRVVHVESGRVLIERARWCDTFASRLRGFTFRRRLGPGQGLVLVESRENKVSAGITMLFVFFDLGILWVNEAGQVVDKVLARPWRPSYLPQEPALTIVEAGPEILDQVEIGDHILYQEP